MGVTDVEVLSFDECTQAVRDKLNREVASLKDSDYETLVSVNEEKERAKVLIKLKDDSIREIIVLSTGESSAIVRIKGNIKPSDLDKVMKDNKPSK